MPEICPNCGLPKEICACETMAKEEKIRISTSERRFRKVTTLITGMSKDIELRKIAKELKTKLACGGTVKNGAIELQGNHKERVKELLIKMGFPEDKIEVA